MEAVGLSGRSVLVTGAHGLLGSWLVRALLERGARVVVIRRDEPAVDSLKLQGLSHEVSVVNGDICADGLIGRALGEYEVDTVFHLAAQTLVGTANRARCRRSRPISAAPGCCSRPAAGTESPA